MLNSKILSAAAGLAFASAAMAQVNDPCAGAIAITAGSSTPFDTTLSTNDGSSSCGAGQNDIWYSYTVTATGILTASTCGAGYDTVVSLISGGCGGTELSCNDDACTGLSSSTSAFVSFGDVVLIRVAGFGGQRGTGTLVLDLAPQVNDACAGAIAVGNGSVTAFDTRGTTTDGSLPSCVFNAGNNLWYSFTAPSAGTLTASLCGSSFDTALSMYADNCAGAEIACNDDDCGLQSTVSGPIASGQTVVIQVGGYNLQSGTGSLAVNFTASGAPNNDNCAQAIAVSNGTPTAFNTINATTDGPENCGFNNAKDIWYSYTACGDGTISASTCGSSFDTVVTIYDGCGGAVLACNDDACGLQSNASFAGVSSGQTVLIQVSGYFGASGAGTLSVTQAGLSNDACATPIAVTSGSSTSFNTTCASTDGPTNCGFNLGHDIWYSFTSASAGTLSVTTCAGASFDTELTAYADSCGGAVLACNDDACGLRSTINAPVAAGQTVLIQLGGFNDQSGSGTMDVNFVPTCTADFNNDSTVDFFDYLDFVDAFSANDPSADFNNDGSIDFFDYLDFVDAFAAGC